MARVIFNSAILDNEANNKIEESIGFLNQALDRAYYLKECPQNFEYLSYLNGLYTIINDRKQQCLNIVLWNKSIISKLESDKAIIISNLKAASIETIAIRKNKIE